MSRCREIRRAADDSRSYTVIEGGVAQWIEHRSSKPRVVGSSPTAPASITVSLQLAEVDDERSRVQYAYNHILFTKNSVGSERIWT